MTRLRWGGGRCSRYRGLASTFLRGLCLDVGGAARCLGATPLARGVNRPDVILSGSHDTKKIHIKIQEVVELISARDISSRLAKASSARDAALASGHGQGSTSGRDAK